MTSAAVRDLLQSSNYGDCISGINQADTLPYAEALALLTPLVTNDNARVRYAAVSKIATVGSADRGLSLELLLERLREDSELDVKAAAADSLGALGLKEAYAEVVALYHTTSDWLLRLSIVAALSEMGEPQAIAVALDALGSDNELLVATAIGAIGELGDATAIGHLEPFVSHGDSQVRYRTAQALGNLGGDRARAWLQQLLNDSDAQVAGQAKTSLEQMGAVS